MESLRGREFLDADVKDGVLPRAPLLVGVFLVQASDVKMNAKGIFRASPRNLQRDGIASGDADVLDDLPTLLQRHQLRPAHD